MFGLNAIAIWDIINEFSLVLHQAIAGGQFTFAITFIIFEIALEFAAIAQYKNTLATRLIVFPIPLIITAILKILPAPAMPPPIKFLPLVRDIIREMELHHAILKLIFGNRFR